MLDELGASTYQFLYFGYSNGVTLLAKTSEGRVFVVEFVIEVSLEARV